MLLVKLALCRRLSKLLHSREMMFFDVPLHIVPENIEGNQNFGVLGTNAEIYNKNIRVFLCRPLRIIPKEDQFERRLENF